MPFNRFTSSCVERDLPARCWLQELEGESSLPPRETRGGRTHRDRMYAAGQLAWIVPTCDSLARLRPPTYRRQFLALGMFLRECSIHERLYPQAA